MSLHSQKAGSKFGGISQQKGGSGTAQPPAFWAIMMLANGFPANWKVIAEGLGTIEVESGFVPSPGGDGAHFGAWQEDSSFGSEADRLDPNKSTAAAYKRWLADGKSFYPAWSRWQLEQSGRNGAAEGVKKYGHIAKLSIEEFGKIPQGGGIEPISAVEGAISGITSAEDFLVELAKTLLDFRKLGQLAAEAIAWLLRLILKAIWDYVVAPLIHWAERAESFYWRNFFSTGTEQGSGFGYQLRQNAGLITIGFWAVSYAILWSDGESLAPTESHNSMLGQAVKKIEGTVARRNLVKPENVEKETPDKPKPNTSTVQIERTRELAVNRKRPVTVTGTGVEAQTGRKSNERDNHRVPRPSEARAGEKAQTGGQKIILPPGVKTAEKTGSQKTPADSESRMDSRTGSGDRAKGSGGDS